MAHLYYYTSYSIWDTELIFSWFIVVLYYLLKTFLLHCFSNSIIPRGSLFSLSFQTEKNISLHAVDELHGAAV